jgi:hypothetical protein
MGYVAGIALLRYFFNRDRDSSAVTGNVDQRILLSPRSGSADSPKYC